MENMNYKTYKVWAHNLIKQPWTERQWTHTKLCFPPRGGHGGHWGLPSVVGTACCQTCSHFPSLSCWEQRCVQLRNLIHQPPSRYKQLMRCKLYVLAGTSGTLKGVFCPPLSYFFLHQGRTVWLASQKPTCDHKVTKECQLCDKNDGAERKKDLGCGSVELPCQQQTANFGLNAFFGVGGSKFFF